MGNSESEGRNSSGKNKKNLRSGAEARGQRSDISAKEGSSGQNGSLSRKAKRYMVRIFLGMLIVPTLLWFVVCAIGAVSPAFKEKTNYDLNEKRKMAAFPTTFSGDLCAEIEDWYNDHVPFRSLLITADNQLKYITEAPYDNGLRATLTAVFHPAKEENESVASSQNSESVSEAVTESASETEAFSDTDSESASPESQEVETTAAVNLPTAPVEAVDDSVYLAPVVSNNYTLLGRENWLFLAGNNIDYYVGNNLPTDEELNTYASTLSQLQTLCDQKGKKLAILMVPCKPQVYSEYMPTYQIENEYKRVARIVDYVTENTSVQISYPLEELQAMKSYYLTYKKYDGHWNAAGSFIGYQEILRMLGMQTTDPLSLTADMSAVGSGGGDLISPGALNEANYQNDYDYFFHYKDNVAQTGTEGEYFVDYAYYRMYSNAECADQVSFIGDSFRNHMILYSYKDFQDSTLIHVSLLGDTTVDQILTDSDTYVLIFVERNDLKMLTAANYLIDLLSR